MTLNGEGTRYLTSKLCDEVQTLVHARFDQSIDHQGLESCIEAVLSAHEHVNEEPESRRVTILLSDIRGFTTLAETFSAMTVVEILNRYFACMTDVIVKYGGTIDKLMGDSIMVLFGAPTTREDDVESAIACAVDMQQAMAIFNEQNKSLGLPMLYMGIGINTGNVVAGALGSSHHREYTVIGDEVNLASRIEAQSLRGQILISESTYELAREHVLVTEPNKVQVKGKREPVVLYELMGTTRPIAKTVPQREVRKSPRIEISMPCHFHSVRGKTVMSTQYCGQVMDIGYNGLLMSSPVPLELYSEVKLAVSLQLLGGETSDIYARVIKTRASENKTIYSLEFTSMDLVGQQSIKRFVDGFIHRD